MEELVGVELRDAEEDVAASVLLLAREGSLGVSRGAAAARAARARMSAFCIMMIVEFVYQVSV